jgi:Tfp pilus assembly protein PilN
MIQQINLYQYSGEDDQPALTNPYLLTLIAGCLFMLISSLISSNRLDNRKESENLLRAQLLEIQAQTQQLQIENAKMQVDDSLHQELLQTQKNYLHLSQLLELLAENESDRSKGFSKYLTTLAEQADSRLWLTGIAIDSVDKSISLSGSTFKAENIATFLRHLQNTKAFNGRHFAKLSVNQSENEMEQIDFIVSSGLTEQNGDNNDGHD